MSITEIQEIAYQSIEEREAKRRLFGEIGDIKECLFDMPASLQALDWIGSRKFPTTAPANAMKGATRTFASHLPAIDIAPTSGGTEEWSRVERLQRGITWNFHQINRLGRKSAHWQIVESAVDYCAVALQTEYLPYTLRGEKGPKYKDALRRSKFNLIVHNPANVNPYYGKHGLENVVLADVRTVQDVVSEFGKENPGVASLLAKVKTETPGTSLRKVFVQFYDYTDYERRVIWCTMAGERQHFSNTIDDKPYVLLDEEHGLGFINWVIVDNDEPIMKTLVDADAYKNANILLTIQQSMFIALAAHPRYWTNTPHGKGVKIDFQSGTNAVDLKPGEAMGILDSPDIDPGFAQAVETMERQIYESSAPKVLSSAETLAERRAAFSTINAIIQLAVSQLSLAKETAERAEEEAIYQMFRWIDYSGVPLTTYMEGTEEGEDPTLTIVSGELPENAAKNEVNFDLDELYITVTLKPQTLVDEAGRLNNVILKYEKLGISQQTALEEMGYQNPGHEMLARLLEDNLRMKRQLKNLQTPENARKQNNSENMFSAADGIDTKAGGLTAQQYASAFTRERITNITPSGDEIV